MKIEGYKYIDHAVVVRPSGVECRFTLQQRDGRFLDGLIPLESADATEEQIVSLISTWLVNRNPVVRTGTVSITNEDGTTMEFEIEKNRIVKNNLDLELNLSNKEREAIDTALPLIVKLLQRVRKVYPQFGNRQKQQLLDHNPTIRAILKETGGL